MNEKAYTGTVVARRDVTVYASSPEEASAVILKLHESGDACADLGAAVVENVRESDENGNEYLLLYPFFLDGIVADPKLNQGDGLHPTAAGVDAIVKGILPKVEELVARVRSGRGN